MQEIFEMRRLRNLHKYLEHAISMTNQILDILHFTPAEESTC